jgi:WD40 repeat protein
LSNAAPGSELSVHSDNTRSTRQTKGSTTAGAGAEYTPSVLFKTEYPLRCFNILGVSSAPPAPDAVKVAIGSNAKSIYTFAYARDQLATSRNLGIIDGPGPGVTLLAELKNIHTGSVYCMDWHEGAGLLVSGSNDKAVRLSKYDSSPQLAVLQAFLGVF